MFLRSVQSYNGYPKVRDLPKLVPSLNSVKLNTILKYLINKGDLLLDSDSNIIWSRTERSDELTMADVANISQEVKASLTDENRRLF